MQEVLLPQSHQADGSTWEGNTDPEKDAREAPTVAALGPGSGHHDSATEGLQAHQRPRGRTTEPSEANSQHWQR